MQIRVIKSDGSTEDYLYTKVLKTLSHALVPSEQDGLFIAEELTQALTYFLYQRPRGEHVTSAEIYSMIQAVLTSTEFEKAAVKLHEYHINRQIQRRRIEVLNIDFTEFYDWRAAGKTSVSRPACCWNKSVIAADLVKKAGLDRYTARAVAGMVEEKVLNIGIKSVPRSLIRQLVLTELAAMMRAQQQFQGETETRRRLPSTNASRADTEVCLRQEQKGLCEVGV